MTVIQTTTGMIEFDSEIERGDEEEHEKGGFLNISKIVNVELAQNIKQLKSIMVFVHCVVSCGG